MARSLRIIVVVLVLVVEVAVIGAVIGWSRWTSEDVLRDHMDDILESAVESSAARTDEFLGDAVGARDAVATMVGLGAIDPTNTAVLQPVFWSLLQTNDVISGVYVGRADGSFFFVTRDEARPGGSLVKEISVDDDGGRTVTNRFLSSSGAVVGVEEDPDDAFDPRERPWYRNADGSPGAVWTDPYVFFTSQVPGVTTSMVLRGPDGQALGILGIDVRLGALSEFLATIPATENSSVFVVDSLGTLVALPEMEMIVVPTDDGGTRLATIGELQQPVVGELIDRFRQAEEPIQNSVVADMGDGDWRAAFRPVVAGDRWLVAMAAPEDDYLGEIRANQRNTMIVALAAAVVAFLIVVPVLVGATRPVSRLQEMAETDPLTGLPRRGHTLDSGAAMLRAVREQGTNLAVALVDIDEFKEVNDAFGHRMGDEVLREMARRLRASLDPEILLGRWGGDELVILVPHEDANEAAATIENARLAVMEEPIAVDGNEIVLTLSAGVTEAVPGADLDQLIEMADRALLRAKADGRDQVVVDVIDLRRPEPASPQMP